jgi:hypothetical protein
MEAIYQAATGEGLDVNHDGNYVAADSDLKPQFAGWRDGTTKVVVLITDAPLRDSDDPSWDVPDHAHGMSATKDAFVQRGVRLVGIAVDDDWGGSPAAAMEELAIASDATSDDGYDVNGNGRYTDVGDIAPGGALVFNANSYGYLIGSVAADVGDALAAAVEAVVPDRAIVVLHGDDAAGLSLTTVPPFYANVAFGTEICFDVTLTGEVPYGDDPGTRDVIVQIIWETGEHVAAKELVIKPEPPPDPPTD